jgi:hypothetical protein
MKFANAIKVHRKSGEAERRDLRFRRPFLEMFFDRSVVERSAISFAGLFDPDGKYTR